MFCPSHPNLTSESFLCQVLCHLCPGHLVSFAAQPRSLRAWAAGARLEPRAGVASRRLCPPGAGCWVAGPGDLGGRSQQVCSACGELQKGNWKPQHNRVCSFSCGFVPEEGAGCGRQVGGEGDRYSFGVRACKVTPALSPKGGHDPTQERMALKTLFLYM